MKIITLLIVTLTVTLIAAPRPLVKKMRLGKLTLNRDNTAIRLAKARGVRGNILNAHISKDRDGKKLFAVSTKGAYYFKFNGEYYKQKYSKMFSNSEKPLNYSTLVDLNGDRYNEFIFSFKSNSTTTLVVYNNHGLGGLPLVYVMTSTNGAIRRSATLVNAKRISAWMEDKLNILVKRDQSVIKESAKLDPNSYKYMCDISTDGKGGLNKYKVGGNYCSLPVSVIDNDIVFQTVSGSVQYLAVHERYRDGRWVVTYQGKLRTLKLSDIRKSRKSTNIIFTINGKHEKYLPIKAKVRVYLKKKNDTSYHITLPSKENAKTILKQRARMRRGENIYGIFVYEENSKPTISAVTNKAVYRVIEARGDWYLEYKYMIKRRKVSVSDRYNGIADIDSDRTKELYFTTIDRKGYKILNVVSFNKKNGIYSAYAKVSEAIGDFDPEVEFKFTSKTPNNFRPWMKNMIYRLGFVKKPREIEKNDPKSARHKWVRDNKFLHLNEVKHLNITYYNGDNDKTFSFNKGLHPTIASINSNGIIYRAHYKGMVTAYDKNRNRSYIIWIPKIRTNFVTSIYDDGRFIFLGMQNSGIIRYNKNSKVLKHFSLKELRNKDIWKIERKGRYFYFKTDGKDIRIRAASLLKELRERVRVLKN